MDATVELLQRLGFGEYEARAYVTLLQRNPANGYELAKASGLPRANIYSVLQKLEERGAVMRVDTQSGTRYVPVSPQELTERLQQRFQDTLDTARVSLEELGIPNSEPDYIWNAEGYDSLLEHARTLISGAQEELLVGTWPEEAVALGQDLARAESWGVRITTLCLTACPTECGGCRGQIHRYNVAPDLQNRWLVLVPDGAELLAGQVSPGDEATAVRTRQRLLVELAGWYIRHSIALAAVLEDVGGRLQQIVSPETRSVLSSLDPGKLKLGWLEHMRQLLSRPSVQAERRKGGEDQQTP